jgi:hypothetical protein
MSRAMLLVIGATALVVGVAAVLIVRPGAPPGPQTAQPDSLPVRQPTSPPQAAPTPRQGPAWLTDKTADSGVTFRHHSGDSTEKPFPSANGSGLAALDYDLDGHIDLLFATGNPFPVRAETSTHSNRCYRNLGGWRFSETTEQTGLAYRGYTHGVTVADYDADGFPDVLITGYGPDVLFHNLGDGRFEPTEVGVEDPRWSSSAAFFDADLDGLLDLYVCHYGNWSLDDNPFCGDTSGKVRVFCSPLTVEPVADAFFKNDGDGRFTDASESSGILVPPGRGLCVLAAHLNDDTAIDLYVANDLNHNVFFAGSSTGTFTDRSDLSGTAYDSLGRVKSSMGIDAADTRGTGRFDLLVTDFQREYNLLFANSGGGMFVDASESSGVGPAGMQLVSWGVQFSDLDLDGLEDALVTSGHVGDERDPSGDLRQSGLVLHNRQGRFEPVAPEQAGEYFLVPHQGRGLIAADLDNDGDEDFVMNHRDESATLLANDVAQVALPNRQAISIRLVGRVSNRDAIGAVVKLSGTPDQVRQIKGGGGYQSTRDPRLFFAVDRDTEASLSIRWPNGAESDVDGLRAGGQYLIVEPTADSPTQVILMQEHGA